MMKSYIWSLPTRVFHWLLVLLILLAFLTDDDDLLNYHTLVGYAILILLSFRFFWGYFGPKYSKFKDFPMSISKVKEFIVNIFSSEQKYVGHNPLASYVMISILAISFLAVITGVLTLGIEEGKGVLSSLKSTFFKEVKLFEEIHEFLSSVLIALIAMHLLGVLSDRLLHSKYKTLESIFNGYKVTKEPESIKLNIFQKLLAAIFLALFIIFLLFCLTTSSNPLIA